MRGAADSRNLFRIFTELVTAAGKVVVVWGKVSKRGEALRDSILIQFG